MESEQLPQSADGQLVVVSTPNGIRWRICSGGTCLEDGSGGRLMARYAALLVSQGRRVPLS